MIVQKQVSQSHMATGQTAATLSIWHNLVQQCDSFAWWAGRRVLRGFHALWVAAVALPQAVWTQAQPSSLPQPLAGGPAVGSMPARQYLGYVLLLAN